MFLPHRTREELGLPPGGLWWARLQALDAHGGLAASAASVRRMTALFYLRFRRRDPIHAALPRADGTAAVIEDVYDGVDADTDLLAMQSLDDWIDVHAGVDAAAAAPHAECINRLHAAFETAHARSLVLPSPAAPANVLHDDDAAAAAAASLGSFQSLSRAASAAAVARWHALVKATKDRHRSAASAPLTAAAAVAAGELPGPAVDVPVADAAVEPVPWATAPVALAAVLTGADASGPLRPPDAVGAFPSMNEVARSWRLSTRQRAAFIVITATVLQHLLARPAAAPASICDCFSAARARVLNLLRHHVRQLPGARVASAPDGHSGDAPIQVLMFVTGEGGTGKSRITAAAREWVAAWAPLAGLTAADAPLRTVAFTGVAAMLVHGATLHSTFGLQFGANKPKRRRPRGAPAARSAAGPGAAAAAWSPDHVDMARAASVSTMMCLLCDETSMCSSRLLAKASLTLNKWRRKPDSTIMGGASCIFMGDW